MIIYFTILFVLYSIVCLPRRLHILQLEGYSLFKYSKHYFDDISLIIIYIILLFVFLLPTIFIATFTFRIICISIYSLLFIVYLYKQIKNHKNNVKLPLKYTRRIIRQIMCYCTLYIIFMIITILFVDNSIALLSITLIPIVSNVFILFCYILLLPIEMIIYQYYLIKGVRKLKRHSDLIIIGITGSYGKTSTKIILTTLLNEKYRVLCTPNSFNTPMGITKTILRDLKDEHQIFIIEMGAKKKGEIKYLCKKFKPQCGILTNIGNAHIDSFKSIKYIIETKNELPHNLYGQNKFMVFNIDNNYVNDCSKNYYGDKAIVGLNGDIKYTVNLVDEHGSNFDVLVNDEHYITAQTKLLGEHNIINILLCVALCIKLKLSKNQILKGIRKLEPIKNRLELIKLSNTTILNDSYNANPQSVNVALNVLSLFNGKQKIVITPGIVEMGELAEYENAKFGYKISQIADIVYIINKVNRSYLLKGLLEGDMPKNQIKCFDNFSQIDFSIFNNNDIVLLVNDLPDNFK